MLTVNIFTDYGEEKKRKDEPIKNTKEENSKSQEEKRKHIKTLIDKIPTDKNALFGYQLDWAIIDNVSFLLCVNVFFLFGFEFEILTKNLILFAVFNGKKNTSLDK